MTMKKTSKKHTTKPTRGPKKTTPAKGRTAVYDATKGRAKTARPTSGADAYESPTIDRPPRGDDEGKKKRELKTEPLDIDWGTTEGPEAKKIPGEAINGQHLARCIRFATKVAPKKGGQIVFTHTDQGTALVSGHDQRRVHTGYLVEGAAMLADIVVPRAEAVKIADALEGLDGPLVRIDAAGMVLVHHGTAQPPLHFNLGAAPITQAWEGPSFHGRTPARVPLRIPAAWQSVACRWPDAISQSNQSDDGIEFLSITDAETGTLLARATLAQEGRDLFPEDERQTEIAGSRTAGTPRVKAAPAEDITHIAGVTLTVSTPNDAVEITVGGAPALAEGVEQQAPAAEAPSASAEGPSERERPVVVEVPEGAWVALSSDAKAALFEPLAAGGPWMQWLRGTVGTRSVAIDPPQASELSARLERLGLQVASRERAKIDGIDCDHWIAGVLS
jgi:hypothetical protein